MTDLRRATDAGELTGRPARSRAMIAAAARMLFWVALVFAGTMALLPHPPALPIDSLGDKFEHSLAFSVLTLLGAAAYPRQPLLRLAERLSFLGALIEVAQSIPSLHRDCDILDWVTDTLAILAAVALIAVVRARRR